MFKKSIAIQVLCFAIFAATVLGSCEEEESGFPGFFKNIRCSVEKGAKKFGEGVKNSYDYIKDRIIPFDNNEPTTVATTNLTSDEFFDIRLDQREDSVILDSEPSESMTTTTTTTTTSKSTETKQLSQKDATAFVEPEILDNRGIFVSKPNCQEGAIIDASGNCRG